MARLIFFDDFLGSTVGAHWTKIHRRGDVSNSEVNGFDPAMVTVANSCLELRSEKIAGGPISYNDSEIGAANYDYRSGMVQLNLSPFTYGTIDVRAKCPGGSGLWPLPFWLLGYGWQPSQIATPGTFNVSGANWPNGQWGEIDGSEFLAGHRTDCNMIVHWTNGHTGGEVALGFDSSSQFAVYRLEWSDGLLVWKVNAEDGNGFVTKRTVSGSNVPNIAMYPVISVAMGGAGGTVVDNTLPQTMLVDYMQITQDGAPAVAHPFR